MQVVEAYPDTGRRVFQTVLTEFEKFLEHYFKNEGSTPVAVSYSAAATPGVDEQTEVGFSFGTRPKLAWKKVSMPKLGVSYLFGDGIHGVRLVIGEVF